MSNSDAALNYVDNKFADGVSFINFFRTTDVASMSYCAGYYLGLCYGIYGRGTGRDTDLAYVPVKEAYQLGWDDAFALYQEMGNAIFGAE